MTNIPSTHTEIEALVCQCTYNLPTFTATMFSTTSSEDRTPTVSSVNVPSSTWTSFAPLQKTAISLPTRLSVAVMHAADTSRVRWPSVVDTGVCMAVAEGAGDVVGASDAVCSATADDAKSATAASAAILRNALRTPTITGYVKKGCVERAVCVRRVERYAVYRGQGSCSAHFFYGGRGSDSHFCE